MTARKPIRQITAVASALLIGAGLMTAGYAPAQAADVYSMATPAAGEQSAALAAFYQQKVKWGACSEARRATDSYTALSLFVAQRIIECGYVTVPVVYPDVIAQDRALGNPWKVEKGRPQTIRIAVSRARAVGKRKGSMLINPGGPGGSGLLMPAGLRASAQRARIMDHYDLVSFDPRGVGASTPSLTCLSGRERDNLRQDKHVQFTAADAPYQTANLKKQVQGCIKSVGKTFLAHIGTRDVVRDMDVIRAAVGDKKLTYIGYSYGTFLGSQYAEAFPNNYRALVLDGVVDPTQDPIEGDVSQARGFQKAFEAWARWCVAQGDCPLGDDARKATSNVQALLRPLQKHPMFTPVMSRPLGFQDAVTGIIASLYSDATWPMLKAGLTQLKYGLGGDIMLALADGYQGRWIDGRYSNTQDVFFAVGCMDNDQRMGAAKRKEYARKMTNAMKFADPGGPVEEVAPFICELWPVRNTIRAHKTTARAHGNILVVSTTGDPATPYESGVRLARDMHAPLVTYVGEGHCAALRGDSCVDRAVGNFITTRKIAGPHTVCKPPIRN